MGFNFGFFGTPEHRVFNYRPRYYNEEKEALKEKFGHVDGTKESEYVPGSYLKGSLRDGNYQRQRSSAMRSSKIIGAVTTILVFVIIYLIAKYFSILW